MKRRRGTFFNDFPQKKSKITEKTGITNLHSHIISNFCVANDSIMIWRPINKEAANKLSNNSTPYMGKRLNVKGKSSTFDPIAGDIPFNVKLSKLAFAEKADVDKFQKSNEEAIQSDFKQHEKILQNIENKKRQNITISKQDIDAFNEPPLLTKIVKQIENRDLYYFINISNDEILWNDDRSAPIFAVKNNDETFSFYNSLEKKFNLIKNKLPKEHQAKQVEIFAYRQFALDKGDIIEKYYPITADYDELVSAPRKVFPFDNNESICTVFTKRLFNELVNGKQSNMEIAANLILQYEEKLKQEHRDIMFALQQTELDDMGYASAWQVSAKIYLKDETQGATSHGPEVNNPVPEPLEDGKYVVFLPIYGRIEILETEQQICDFINSKRNEGFPLDINPKWGWDIDETGKLYIPQYKFNWIKVHQKLNDLENSIGAEDNQELKETLKFQFKAEMEIVNIKIRIEKLKLEPEIIYGVMEKRKIITFKQTIQFTENVSELVRKYERKNRMQLIKKLTAKLRSKNTLFIENFGESSLIAQEELHLDDLRNGEKEKISESKTFQ